MVKDEGSKSNNVVENSWLPVENQPPSGEGYRYARNSV